MEPRLFSFDFQLITDLFIMIIALVPFVSVPLIISFIIRSGKRNKSDCNSCPYQDNDIYH